MTGKFGAAAAAIALIAGSPVNGTENPRSERFQCRVVDGHKLPAEGVGEAAICPLMRQAIAARTPVGDLSVEIRVLSPSSLAATVTAADGRRLAEQRMAIADRTLIRGSVERFAEALAAELTRSGRR